MLPDFSPQQVAQDISPGYDTLFVTPNKNDTVVDNAIFSTRHVSLHLGQGIAQTSIWVSNNNWLTAKCQRICVHVVKQNGE